jgi:hypothetical protein
MSELKNSSHLDRLELEALAQRNQIHESVAELKSQVGQVRHDLDPAVNARKHFAAASIGASLVCFLAGYGFGGFFTR